MAEASKDESAAIGGSCPVGGAAHPDICHPFGKAEMPRQQLTLLSFIPLPQLSVAPTTGSEPKVVCQAATTKVAGRAVDWQVDACLFVEHTQTWLLDHLGLGDFVAEMSLAPNEQRELETYRMERTLVEQSREDSSQFESTREISTTDRESTSVSATASKVNGWTATSSMDFGVGATIPIPSMPVKVDGNFKVSSEQHGQTTVTTDNRTEHIHEATIKAAEKLLTQTKVLVRTTRETIVSATDRRTLRNPSPTDSLHLYAYEVNKYFTVATWPSRAVPALRVRVQPLKFDAAFVAENPGFLQSAVVDEFLGRAVGDAHQAASALTVRSGDALALDILERLLFDDVDPDFANLVPNMPPDTTDPAAVFDLSWPRRQDFDKLHLLFWKEHYDRIHQVGSGILKQEDKPKPTGGQPPPKPTGKLAQTKALVKAGDQHTPESAPTETAQLPEPQDGDLGSRRPNWKADGDSGLWEWVQTSASSLFLQWRYLFWLRHAAKLKSWTTAARFWTENRGELLRRYAEQVSRQFTGAARAVLVDFGEATQLARRLDAFQLVAETAFGPAGSLPSRSTELALVGLLAHLNGNAALYTERYLGWVEQRMGRTAVATLLNEAAGLFNFGSDKYFEFDDTGVRWFELNEVRRIGCDYLVPLHVPKATGSSGSDSMPQAIAAMAALAKGLAVDGSEVQALLGGGQVAAPTGDRPPAGGEPVKGGRKGAKVVVTHGVQVLADGVHVVAATERC